MTSRNTPRALAYLARRPYDNVYVQWLIESGLVDRLRDASCSVAIERGGTATTGVCLFGAQCVPCGDDDATIALFVARARRTIAPRMIVGPRPDVERFFAPLRRQLPRVRQHRESQPVYALDRAHLRGDRSGADVQIATRAERLDLAEQSAFMIAGETGTMPNPRSPDFLARTDRIIAARWWWRLHVNGELAFQCNVGSMTKQTAQIQGVWTPPAMRGAGHATRALAAICDHLLDVHPTLCLFVNDFNTAAIALYERVGFYRVGEFATILF